MPTKISEKIGVILLFVAFGATLCRAQAPTYRPAPATATTIDSSEAMFATMCALYAAGYDGEVNADNWTTYRSQMRERLRAQKGPGVDALKEFYKGHQFRDPAAMLSRFVWFGLVSGPAPKFRPVLPRDELPPDVIDLEGFSEILSTYYTEQNIGRLYRDVQPLYGREIERLHEPISQIVFEAGNYLRAVVDPTKPKTFTVIVEPLVGRITNVRNFVDHYAVILSGSDEIPTDVVRHAYLHFLLDGVSLEYPHIITVKRPLYEIAAKAPRLAPDLKDDFPSWFGECTVRAVEIKLKKMSPSEREAALESNDADGYVLVRPIFMGLADYEKSEPSFNNYFPDLIRAIDVKTELTRVTALRFAPAEVVTAPGKDLSGEVVAKKRLTTLPGDPAAIEALTEGEKQLSAKNPRAAEASFKSVLEKYPNQPRAWYGLGMVAVLDHDAERAKEVFGRLTAGQYAASQDPLVMAWSHIYLARIFADEGQLDRAKSEYQAALDVPGAPSRAQEAAQKGMGDLDLRKPSERP